MLLNCDLGENEGDWSSAVEPLVMPHIDMANIACGFHAGNTQIMHKTVALAKLHQVKIGAHPSYPDRSGFGRRSMALRKEEIEKLMIDQLSALSVVCESHVCQVGYVKPHGALYNDMMKNDSVLFAVFAAMKKFDQNIPLLLMATADNQSFKQKADQFGLSVMFEAFADRAYDEQGFLVSRSIEGAVYTDPERILKQAMRLKEQGSITSISGNSINIEAHTLCVHGDNAESVRMIQSLRQCLGA